MKAFFPCPFCNRFNQLPSRASDQAVLCCPACRHEFAISQLNETASNDEATWEVVTDPGADSLFTTSEEIESFSVNEDAPTFEPMLSEPEKIVGEREDRWSPPSTDFGIRTEDMEKSELPRLNSNDGLAAMALAANGDPDTFVEQYSEDQDDSSLVSSPSDTEVDNFLEQAEVVAEEALPFDDDKAEMLPQSTLTDDADLTLEAGLLSSDQELEWQVDAEGSAEEPAELMFDLEEQPTHEASGPTKAEATAEILKPRASAPVAEQRGIAPEVNFDLSDIPVRKKKNSPLTLLLSVLLGGIGAIPIAMLLIWQVLGTDPFELGPMTAQYVPWVVPEALRGSVGVSLDQLPSIPAGRSPASMDEPEPVAEESSPPASPSSNTASTEGFSLPPTEKKPVPADGKAPEELLDASIFAIKPPPDVEPPEPPQPPTPPPKPTEPERNAVGELGSTPPVALSGTPTEKPTDADSSDPATKSAIGDVDQSADQQLRDALTQVEKSFAAWDDKDESSKSAFVAAMYEFAMKLSKLPADDYRLASWRNRAMPVLNEIIADQAMMKAVLDFDTKRNDGSNADIGWVGMDFIVIDASSRTGDANRWRPSNRARNKPPLGETLVVIPDFEKIDDKELARFWTVGVMEAAPSGENRVFRALIAIRR
jgi:hypothetical protein